MTVRQDGSAALLPGPGHAPAPDTASVLHRVLADYGVDAQVTTVDLITDPALRIALERAEDAHRLAELILANLPEPHAAARRVRTVLAEAGIEAESVRVVHGLVSLGEISAQDALTLYDILHNGRADDGAELDVHSWRGLEALADRLACVLHPDVHGALSVLSNPACSTCDSRPHQITLGLATPAQAREFAETVQQANTPQPPAEPASATHDSNQITHQEI